MSKEPAATRSAAPVARKSPSPAGRGDLPFFKAKQMGKEPGTTRPTRTVPVRPRR